MDLIKTHFVSFVPFEKGYLKKNPMQAIQSIVPHFFYQRDLGILGSFKHFVFQPNARGSGTIGQSRNK
jgi:hypothetical protein